MAQKLVSIPVWTENAIFGKRVSLGLLAREVPYKKIDHRIRTEWQ